MKRIIIAAFAFMLCVYAGAQEQRVATQTMQQVKIEEFKIVKDEIVDGVRVVCATPSEKVCSKQIDIKIKDGIIQEVKFTRGCPGNALGIGALIKDMTVEEAVKRLDGIQCGNRGTSCPDQLANVLKALK